jgi:hypothetical protein
MSLTWRYWHVPTGLERLDEVLHEQESRLTRFNRKVLLNLLALLSPKRRVGQDHVKTVLLLDVIDVLTQRIGVNDVGRLDAVQDHVHDRNHVGQALLFLAVEGLGLQCGQVGCFGCLRAEVLKSLAQETGGSTRTVVNALANLGRSHLDHGSNQGAGRVVLAAVATGIAHIFDLGFVQVGQLMLFRLRPKTQLVHPRARSGSISWTWAATWAKPTR